jgi:hypothetical protein
MTREEEREIILGLKEILIGVANLRQANGASLQEIFASPMVIGVRSDDAALGGVSTAILKGGVRYEGGVSLTRAAGDPNRTEMTTAMLCDGPEHAFRLAHEFIAQEDQRLLLKGGKS